MKLKELKEMLKDIPDDAEVSWGRYQGYFHTNRKPCLIITLGDNDIFVDVPEYKGLPR